MAATIDLSAPDQPAGSDLINGSRIGLWLVVTLLWASLRALSSETGFAIWVVRCGLITGLGVLAYGLLDRWPRRLPAWAPRWVVQLATVVAIMPPTAYLSYVLTTGTLDVFALGEGYRSGWLLTTFTGVLMGPWIALAALLRRSEAFAREQAMAFQLKSSELERTALDSRLKLLQAQLAPHFLFNTLANIRSLVRKSGSPDAAAMLDSLIVYLRAAVPRLDGERCTIAQERLTVCAYLELMQMRMPDRLRYAVVVAPDALPLHCPQMAILTLVENAIKHGIDPSEDGGTVDVQVVLRERRVHVRVADSGAGLPPHGAGARGVGLVNLRERLALLFGDQAHLRISGAAPRGTVAEIEFPAVAGAPA